jgi:hypothetical protein
MRVFCLIPALYECVCNHESMKYMVLISCHITHHTHHTRSAIAIAKSLEINATLKVLHLGYNSFGDVPSQILGKAIMRNRFALMLICFSF